MRPIKIEMTGNGSEQFHYLPFPYHTTPSQMTIKATTDGVDTGYTADYGMEPLWYRDGTSRATDMEWFDLTLDADDQVVVDFPVAAIRLALDATGTDTVTWYIVQYGPEK